MLNPLEFKETTAVLIIVATACVGVALLGTNPLAPTERLDPYVRAVFGLLALIVVGLLLRAGRAKPPAEVPPPTAEYKERFEAAQKEFAQVTPDFDILGEVSIGRVKFVALNANIANAKTDVVVSSDDNHFTARGGVAKAILAKGGATLEQELQRIRGLPFRQGQVAVTTGGSWNRRALIHAAVIDFDENRYPTDAVIRKLTRRSLECAVAIGARSVAFPVLGGGTASKLMTPENSVKALAEETIEFLQQHLLDEDASLTYVALYIFNRSDASGLPPVMSRVATIG